jgi:transposase
VAQVFWPLQPDRLTIHRELRRKGVTLQLLWEEHRAAAPLGYRYSRFCEFYRAWEGGCRRPFVDYSGTTLEVINGLTGEVITAQLFVARSGHLCRGNLDAGPQFGGPAR